MASGWLDTHVWLLATLVAGGCTALADEPPTLPALTLLPSDRVLVLAPHPDDEVLGCAGVIQQARSLNLPLRVMWLTYGDANQWSFALYRKHPVVVPGAVRQMGEVRHDEALTAARILDLDPTSLTFLGYPDFGMLAIWNQHWSNAPPYRSLLARATAVPYADALRPGAPYKGEEVLRDITAVLRDFRPTKIFVSHPADHHGDHRALYLFTKVALWDLKREQRPTPALYPYLVHYNSWPRPFGCRPKETLVPPVSLRETVMWHSFALSDGQLNSKQSALRAHRSQCAASGRYLMSFIRANELFGDFPPVTTTSEEVRERPVVMPDQLTAVDRATFVGVTRQLVRVDDSHLVVTIELSRPLAREVELSIYAFGYRPDRPFATMPKLEVRVSEIHHALFDQKHKLLADSFQLTRSARRVVVLLPLATLGQPDRVLISGRTTLADLPLDWTAWRVVKLAESVESGSSTE